MDNCQITTEEEQEVKPLHLRFIVNLISLFFSFEDKTLNGYIEKIVSSFSFSSLMIIPE